MTKPLPISITVSDPWDVGEAVNWRTIRGVLLQTADAHHGGKVLMRFDHDINYRGSAYRYAVGSPRLEGRHVVEIEAGKASAASLSAFPRNKRSRVNRWIQASGEVDSHLLVM